MKGHIKEIDVNELYCLKCKGKDFNLGYLPGKNPEIIARCSKCQEGITIDDMLLACIYTSKYKLTKNQKYRQ